MRLAIAILLTALIGSAQAGDISEEEMARIVKRMQEEAAKAPYSQRSKPTIDDARKAPKVESLKGADVQK